MRLRKQPAKTEDYLKASDIVDNLKPGQQDSVHVKNIKAFRKYISDLSTKGESKKFTTRYKDGICSVWRLS